MATQGRFCATSNRLTIRTRRPRFANRCTRQKAQMQGSGSPSPSRRRSRIARHGRQIDLADPPHEAGKHSARCRLQGYRRLCILMQCAGRHGDPERLHRPCREKGLPKRPRRRNRRHTCRPRSAACGMNRIRAMTAPPDRLFDQRPFRRPNTSGRSTRPVLVTTAGTKPTAGQLIDAPDRLTRISEIPRHLRAGTGPDFARRRPDRWAPT